MIWDQYQIPWKKEEDVEGIIIEVSMKLQSIDGITPLRNEYNSDPIFEYKIDDKNLTIFEIVTRGTGLEIHFFVDLLPRWQMGLMESIVNEQNSRHFRTTFVVGSDGILYAKNFIQYHDCFSSDYIIENIANTILEIYNVYWSKIESRDFEDPTLNNSYYYMRPNSEDEAPLALEEICNNLPGDK